jgi:hypothetical protein
MARLLPFLIRIRIKINDMEIVISQTIQQREIYKTITIQQFQKKREQRRRRVAMRQLKRFPLFAVEIMQDEFPNYDYDTFVLDVTWKTRKSKKVRKTKSPLKLQGRYPLMSKALSNYAVTKDVRYLQEAQSLRNRLYLPFEVVFKLGKEQRIVAFNSTTSVSLIYDLGKITFQTWEQLDDILKEKLRYAHCG